MKDDSQDPTHSAVDGVVDMTDMTQASLDLDRREAQITDMEAVATNKTRRLNRLNDRSERGFWDWELGTDHEWYSTRLVSLLDYGLADPFANELMRLLAQATAGSVKETRRIRERIANARDFDERIHIINAERQPVWLRIRCAVSADGNGEHYSAGAIEDITDRVLLETERAGFAEELERSNAALEAFADVASHDLKSPLRHIGESIRKLQEPQDGDTFKEAQTGLQGVQARIGQMSNLLDGLLDYSRVGRAKDRITTVDVQVLIDDVLALHASPSQIKIDLDCEAAQIETNVVALQTCVRNILDNAIKHADNANPCLLLELRDEDTNVVISVHDNGPGIPEQQKAEVFDLFRTLEQAEGTRGSGMGLAIVKKYVRAHGAAISIGKSELGGACFVLSWPKQAV